MLAARFEHVRRIDHAFIIYCRNCYRQRMLSSRRLDFYTEYYAKFGFNPNFIYRDPQQVTPYVMQQNRYI